ncbi:MAG: type II toxin-antitoxin system VapB family antitoxin [Deltaproteobacteria bacterium]|nr:type II toxin-antitoxin system VapB family antitoxin [Deltaproteobacteria bacterium]
MARTNIVLDDRLVHKGMRLTGIKTKKELVNTALRDFVRRKNLKKILELEGKIQWVGNLDEMRKSRV